MSLARDGSLGVLSMLWRRVVVDERLYVHETWAGDIGVLYGPMVDVPACTALIRKRAAEVKAAFLAGRAAAAAAHGVAALAKSATLAQDGLEDDPATETTPGP